MSWPVRRKDVAFSRFFGARTEAGVTLIELLLTIFILVIVVVSLSLFFPKASTSVQVNRQLLVGTGLATSKLEEIEKASYAVVTPTPAIPAYFPGSGTSNASPGGCDCVKDERFIDAIPLVRTTVSPTPPDDTEVAGLPTGDIISQGGVKYTRKVCINQIRWNTAASKWESSCAGVGGWNDTGLKYVHVRVSWISKATNDKNNQAYADVRGVVAQQ